jgi:hypothetical protein
MEREQKKSNELYNVEDVTILPSPVVINSETSSTSPQYIDKPSSEILPTDGNAFEGYFGKNDPGNLLPGYYGVSKPLPSSPTPSSPAYVPSSPAYVPSTSSSVPSPPSYPPLSPSSPPPSSSSSYPPLSPSSPPPSTPSTILEVPKDEEKKDENNDKDSETQSDLDNKKVIEMSNQDVNKDTSTSETKKINI